MSNEKKSPQPVSPSAPVAEMSVKDLVKEIVSEVLPTAVAVAVQAGKPVPTATQVAASKYPPGIRCGDCGQYLTACKEEHVQMVVFPKRNPKKNGKWFQGVFINGVRYLSVNSSHRITVPKNAEIAHLVQQWEKNEEELSTGREVNHDSGIQGNFKPATQAWR